MPTVRGKAEVKAYVANAPKMLAAKVLPGAARAAAKVVADEAKSRSVSAVVSENITIKTTSKDGRIVVRISVKPGWARSVGIWLEYGTSPHFITVDDSQRAGMSVGRVNKRVSEGSLVIGGKFVGATVHHPGAKPHPFLRVSLDLKAGEAVAAAQSYINSRGAGSIAEETEQ